MTRNVDTLTTLTTGVIKYKAADLSETTDSDSDDRYDKLNDLTEEIIDTYVSQLSFTETMIFAQTLCNEYDVARAFPSEQRSGPLSFADDWREAATSGLYHLILDSIRKESENDEHGYAECETFGNRDVDNNQARLDTDTEEQIYTSDVYAEADTNLYRVLEYDLKQVKEIGNRIISDVIETGEEFTQVASIDELKDSDFIVKTLVINYITDSVEFYTWEGMSDTACRDKFAHAEFTDVIDTVIGEFETFYDPGGEHATPDSIKE